MFISLKCFLALAHKAIDLTDIIDESCLLRSVLCLTDGYKCLFIILESLVVAAHLEMGRPKYGQGLALAVTILDLPTDRQAHFGILDRLVQAAHPVVREAEPVQCDALAGTVIQLAGDG